MKYIEKKAFKEPLISIIGLAKYNAIFGEDFDVDRSINFNNRQLIFYKMYLVAINSILEKIIPDVYNIKEHYKEKFSMKTTDMNNYLNIKHVDDLKIEMFDDVMETLSSFVENYDSLVKNTSVLCEKSCVMEYKKFFEKYFNELKIKIDNGDIIFPNKLNVSKREVFKLYLTKEEKDIMMKKAKENGKTLSGYIRYKILYD